MSDYVLSCCSTVDLSREHLERRDIQCVFFHYFLDDKEYMDDLGQTMPLDKFYKAMTDGAMTKTAQVNISEYLDFFTPFRRRHRPGAVPGAEDRRGGLPGSLLRLRPADGDAGRQAGRWYGHRRAA